MIDLEKLLKATAVAIAAAILFGLGWVSKGEASSVTCNCHFPHPDSAAVDSVASILWPRARDTETVEPLARIVVAEARAKRIDPVLFAGVIRTENPWLVADTFSHAGAIGIAQIMPFHEGGYGCAGPLDDAGTSVCLGTAILRDYLERALRRGLLDYNGCRRTPGCERYVDHVTAGIVEQGP